MEFVPQLSITLIRSDKISVISYHRELWSDALPATIIIVDVARFKPITHWAQAALYSQ